MPETNVKKKAKLLNGFATVGEIICEKRAKEMRKKKKLPVTVLSGFLGAGKTTLLKHVLKTIGESLRIALIVNDVGSINLDGLEIKSHGLVQEKAEMVELQNGCACCTLRGDLLKTVKMFAMKQDEKTGDLSYDYLIVESTGIAEPLPVAQTFVLDCGEEGDHDDHDHDHDIELLQNFAQLDTMVTVVDSHNILSVLSGMDSIAERRRLLGKDGVSKTMQTREEQLANTPTADASDSKEEKKIEENDDQEEAEEEEEEEKSLSQLLLDQIEFSNVILVNKADLLIKEFGEEVGKAKLDQIVELLKKLNPVAKVITPPNAHFKDFLHTSIMNTNLFDMKKAQVSSGWIQELAMEEKGIKHMSELKKYGIGSISFRNYEKPFHPERLAAILNGFGKLDTVSTNDDNDPAIFAGVVRAKGQLWIANIHACPVDIHCAGRQLEMAPLTDSPFCGAVYDFIESVEGNNNDENNNDLTKEDVDMLREQASSRKKVCVSADKWNEKFGDRHSKLVCIGISLDKKGIRKALEDALLTDEEMKDISSWKDLPNPFFGENGYQLFEIDASFFLDDEEDCGEEIEEEQKEQ